MKNQRMWDLVRQQRMELLQAELITREEYALLAQDHAAVPRLESYDDLRRQVKEARAEAESQARDAGFANLAVATAADELTALRADVAQLRGALEKMPCSCAKLVAADRCPQCDGRLLRVIYLSGSMLNREQFDESKAGDYYCTKCKGDEARTGFKYFWERDFPVVTIECNRCAALAANRLQNTKAHDALPCSAPRELGINGWLYKLVGPDPKTRIGDL
jgi:hypothetical protein